MSEIRTTICQGCGRTFHDDLPERARCGECPPRKCEKCGQMDAPGASCSCWISLEGMALADVKAMFARDGGFELAHDIEARP
ncbi:hypothetical protein NONO_c60250 [Nocardia nova SH22a]|uniref:Uncharacterized protein n=1 Tax=Nocardia nova SH22a TaxID=1415166 RepID=W5TUC4_9NOCA|nr:hypothetical protein NONO_c60250 [Nocardia nova SH22a]